MRYVDLPHTLRPPRIAPIDALRGLSIFCIIGLDSAMLTLAEMSRDKGSVAGAIGNFPGMQFTM